MICIVEMIYDTLKNLVIETDCQNLEMDFQALFVDFMTLNHKLKGHHATLCEL